MANDKGRTHKDKDDENIKLKKKTVTPDASPASSSRRSSRDTSSGKQAKESPMKENLINTRKSVRLEQRKPSGTTPTKEKSEKTRGEVLTTPTKTYDRRKKSDADNNSPVSPAATSSLKSKKGKVGHGGGKRKRAGTSRNKGVSESSQVKTEEGDGDDKKDEEASSDASSSSSREVGKSDSSKSGKDKDDIADSNGEESLDEASKRQKTSDQKESLNDGLTDLEQDRNSCESVAPGEINGMSKTNTSICIACKKLRCYHLPLVKESIWDTREVEVTEGQVLQKQKQYFVKYKGHAHVHNQWIPESQLRLEAPLLVENYSKNDLIKWNEEWTVPHQLLKKRLVLSLKPISESEVNTVTVLNYHNEWLVQWQGLDYEQATWESENVTVLDSPEGHKLVKDYEKDPGNTKKDASSDNDRMEEITLKLPAVFAGCPPGTDHIQVNYAKNLHDAWAKGQNSIIFDDQERTLRIVLFILSLKSVSLPFLLITRSSSLSLWETMFSNIARNAFQVSVEETDGKPSYRLIHVQKEDGELAFQLLLLPVDEVVKDLNVLKAIKWEAIVVDESQSSEMSSHFSQIKSLSTEKRLLVYCGPLGVSNLDVMSLLDCDIISKTELADIGKLKETLSKLIAYECKPAPSKFVEYWVPVQISNVQLEQYCSMLLSNAMALSASSKSDTFGALHEILVSARKCCDHPYIVDQSLQAVLTKDLELGKFLDVGIKASGKLQFLDLILPEMRKRQLRVLIMFHPLSGSGKFSTSIGDILDDFVRQRFGEDSYERVDGIGMIPSKKQAALNNFNNKEMGRFIFLLEHRACLSSIKLSSVDTVIIFDSDWNPANDFRALQRIVIDSCSEQVMVFRLYTSLTLEEKILKLAEHNVTINGKLQNLSRSTSDELLMWGATHLFKKLDEFHNHLNVSSEECWWNELREEVLDLISYKSKKDAEDLKITRAKPTDGTYGKNVALPNKLHGEQPHEFWKKLFAGRDPCWKYLSKSTSRQRGIKRPQYVDVSPRETNVDNDDVPRSKRKKITNNVAEPVASKPVAEEQGGKPVTEEQSGKPAAEEQGGKPETDEQGEMSFPDFLKLKISKLCEVLGLSEEVKIMVQRFLEYIIENYRVNKEPENTLHAFLISLCWIGAEMLKHKLDKRQSVSLAKEHLHYTCIEEEANSVYLKLESAKAKDMFLLDMKSQTETAVSTDAIPDVKTEVPDIPPNQFDDNHGADHNQDHNQTYGEVAAAFNPDTSDAQEQNNDNSLVPPVVSPALGQSAPADLVIESNLEASLPQPREETCLPSENQSDVHIGEQAPVSQNPLVSAPSEQVPIQGGSNQFDFGNSNQRPPQKMHGDPLQAELERLREMGNYVSKCYDAIKLKIKSDHEKELAEVIAQINAKYEAINKDADASFQSKTKEIEACCSKVIVNKALADTYRSKFQNLTPLHPSEIQVIQLAATAQHLQARSNGMTSSSSPAQSVRSQQVTEVQPPLQIVNQPSQLFATTPTRAASNANPSTMPTRVPPSTVVPINTSNVPFNTATVPPFNPTSTPNKLPFTPTSTPNKLQYAASTPNQSPSTPASTPNKPPFTAGMPSRALPGINTMTPSGRYSRPPPNITPTPPSVRNARTTEIRATPPHLRSFRPPMTLYQIMQSQRPSNMSPLSQTSARPSPAQTTPLRFPANQNSQPTQNSPISFPLTSSQPPSTSVPVSSPTSFPPPSQTQPSHFPTNHNSQSTQNLPRSLPITSSQPPSTTSVPVALPTSFPPPSQTPPHFPTNQNNQPTQNSPRSLPLTSSQPPSTSVPVAPPTSFPPPSQTPPPHFPSPRSLPLTSSQPPSTSVPIAPPTSFPPPSQTSPPNFSTNQNSQPTQNSPRSLPLTSSQPPSTSVPVVPPTFPPPSQTPPPHFPTSQPSPNSPSSLPSSQPSSPSSVPPSSPSQTPPPHFPTSQPTQNSSRSLPITSSQPPSTSSVPPSPPTSSSPPSQAPPPLFPASQPTHNSSRSLPITSSQPPSTSSVPAAPPTSFPPPSQTPPPHFPTNHNSEPTQNSPRSLPITSSQPPSTPVPVAPAPPPPTSFQPPLFYSWYPSGTLPAASSSHPQVPLPPLPPVSISHTGLYNPADMLSRPALDLLTDIDKQGGLHPPNTSVAPPEILDLTGVDQGGGSELVCLSDDED